MKTVVINLKIQTKFLFNKSLWKKPTFHLKLQTNFLKIFCIISFRHFLHTLSLCLCFGLLLIKMMQLRSLVSVGLGGRIPQVQRPVSHTTRVAYQRLRLVARNRSCPEPSIFGWSCSRQKKILHH